MKQKKFINHSDKISGKSFINFAFYNSFKEPAEAKLRVDDIDSSIK